MGLSWVALPSWSQIPGLSPMAAQQNALGFGAGAGTGGNAMGSAQDFNNAQGNGAGANTGGNSPNLAPLNYADPLPRTLPGPAQNLSLPPLKTNDFQKFILETSGYKLPIFGQDFFENLQFTQVQRNGATLSTQLNSNIFAPLENSPVNDNYTVGPGDQVVVRVWGSINEDAKLIIDRNGLVSIPRVGTVNVAGVKASQLEGIIKNAFFKYYKNFELSVTLGQLRTITVYVVGQARRPGSYSISSLSTLSSALFATGGVNANGSMRRIQLKRDGKVISEFDLYDFLTQGNKTNDLKLIDGDVLFIPAAYGYAALVGKVNNSAIFELKNEGETIEKLLSIAGGLPVTADQKRGTLERVNPKEKQPREVINFSIDPKGLLTPLKSGDLLTILSISPELSNSITLRGAVSQPIRLAWTKGMRIRDLIPNKESLISRDSIRRQNETLFDVNQLERTQIDRLELPADLRAGNNTDFSNNPNNPNNLGMPVMGALGATNGLNSSDSFIKKPFTGAIKDIALDTLSRRIGDLYDEINLDYAVIERLTPQELKVTLIPFNLGRVLADEKDPDNQLLQPGDIVTVFSAQDIRVPLSKRRIMVRIEGEVAKPGVYQATPGETLSTVIQRAGGLTHDAYLFGSNFTREAIKLSQQENLDRLVKRLDAEYSSSLTKAIQSVGASADIAATQSRVLASQNAARQAIERLKTLKPEGRITLGLNPELYNHVEKLPELHLENGDRLLIPARPDFVYVFGSINSESALIYRPNLTVADYLKLSGVTAGADRENVILARADGTAITNGSSFWDTSVNNIKVLPGDTILMPEKLDQESSWSSVIRSTKDISQIFYQMGLGVAAIKILKQ